MQKYILIFVSLVLGSTSLHAVAQEKDHVLNSLNSFEVKMIRKALPASLQATVSAQLPETTAAADDEQRLDSTVLYSADIPATKSIYSYDDQEGSTTITEQHWDATLKSFVSASYETMGPKTDDQPKYVIKGSFDENGQPLPLSRVDYDLTAHVELSDACFPEAYNQPYTQYYWNNGQWQLDEQISAEYKDLKIISLTTREADANGVVSMADSVTISYNEANLPISLTRYDKECKKVGTFTMSYDEKARLLKYGYDDDSWYLEYQYANDTACCTEYELVDGVATIQHRVISITQTGGPNGDIPGLKTAMTTEEYYLDGKALDNKKCTLVTFTATSYSMSRYTINNKGEKEDESYVTIEQTDGSMIISYSVYDSKTGTSVNKSYRTETEKIDTYTKCEVFYDELNLECYRYYFYYHNPNATGIDEIVNILANDGPLYDIMGRTTSNKKGLLSKGGKIVYVK